MSINCILCGGPIYLMAFMAGEPCESCGSTCIDVVAPPLGFLENLGRFMSRYSMVNVYYPPADDVSADAHRECRMERRLNATLNGIEFVGASKSLDDGKHVLVSSTDLRDLEGAARGTRQDMKDGRCSSASRWRPRSGRRLRHRLPRAPYSMTRFEDQPVVR